MFRWAREHRNSGRRKVNAPTILHGIYTRDGCISGTLNTATWLRAECTQSGFDRRDLSLHAHAIRFAGYISSTVHVQCTRLVTAKQGKME